MPIFIGRLYRMVPLIIGLIVLAAIVYTIVLNTKGAQRAKEAVIKLFWWVCCLGTAFFFAVAMYALAEHNYLLVEFFGGCMVIMLIFWGIDLYCRHNYRKHGMMIGKKKPGDGDESDRSSR